MEVRRTVASTLLGLLVLPLAAFGGSPASAARPEGSIESVTPVAGGFDVTFRGGDLAWGSHLDAGSVQVTLDGEPVRATLRSAAPDAEAVPSSSPRQVALVVDTSGSMAGAPLDAARAAATAYLTAVPSDVQVSLVTFAGHPRVEVPPTTDRSRISRALPGLTAFGGTSMYDAVLLARETLGDTGERRILLLGDGADSASRATLEQAAAAVAGARIGLDTVALGPTTAVLASLRHLSEVGEGRLLRAGDDVEAVAAFQDAALAFSADLLLHVEVPSDAAAGAAALQVQAVTDTGEVVRAALPVVVAARATSSSLPSSRAVLVAGLLAVFGGLATALVVAVKSGDAQAVGRRRSDEVLARYTLRAPLGQAAPESSRIGDGALARAALALATRFLARGKRGERLTNRLDRAAVRFTAREWLVLQGTVALLGFVVTALLSGVLLAVLAGPLCPLVAHVWLSVKASRRAAAFEDELSDALQLVASGLSTGYSLPQALDSVVKEGRPPLSEELGRALAETRLGAPLEAALDRIADRMDSNDFRWVVMAIRVQREVGGNLSEVLTTLCQTMRERSALRRQIKALSAEGRMGALILILMPIFVVAYLSLINPDFFRPMWETTLGNLLLGGSTVALAIGALWMKKIVKVEA